MIVTRPIVETRREAQAGDDQRHRERQLDAPEPLRSRVAHAVGRLEDVGRDAVEAGHDVAHEDHQRVHDERDLGRHEREAP